MHGLIPDTKHIPKRGTTLDVGGMLSMTTSWKTIIARRTVMARDNMPPTSKVVPLMGMHMCFTTDGQ